MNNISKSSIVKSNISKGLSGVTWDEADFTWDQGLNSTWDSVNAIVTGNIQKSSIVKSNITKNTV